MQLKKLSYPIRWDNMLFSSRDEHHAKLLHRRAMYQDLSL